MYNHYFLGLDVGTDSVGYAVSNAQYELLKYKGEPMWGVHLFEAAETNSECRSYRTARRRLDRRQQRVRLVQEIFAAEISKIDENFYRRIKESALWREDAHDAYSVFHDADYTDKEYYRQYPTIHHLIWELIDDPAPHDVRLVYLACAWLVSHRGHFFSDVSKENVETLSDVESSYKHLMDFFEGSMPWSCEPSVFGEVLKKKLGVNAKYKELCMLLFDSPKAPKTQMYEDEPYYSVEHMLKMLCGGTVAMKDLYGKEIYAELPSLSLNCAEDKLEEVLGALGDDGELLLRLKALFDWAVLADTLSGGRYISKKKKALYDRHKEDAALLKRIIRKYVPERYNEVFRDESRNGYAGYIKNRKQEEFCKFIKGVIKDITPEMEDSDEFSVLCNRLESTSLCPMQVQGDNRVIPYQVYWVELQKILDNAAAYLPFLNQSDSDGYITKDKLLSIMEFRVPYYVGPLNSQSKFSWIERKAEMEGKIFPWNFAEMVDLDKSEQAFINKMTNTCTYLPYAQVLPKCSLLHERFQVLNEINTLNINGKRIPVELKQKLYTELFSRKKKVTVKDIKDLLLREGICTKCELDTLSGIDQTIKSSLNAAFSFRRLLEGKILTETQAEKIIENATYMEDRSRFAQWIHSMFPHLSEEDRKYLSRLRFKDFARLSAHFLENIYGTETENSTGEAMSIIERMWRENLNLMELLSDRYTYKRTLQEETELYYREHPLSLDERMKQMYISNAVKRPIIRTLEIVSDVVKATGAAPQKIFIEMARGGEPEKKGKRTKSRYQQLKELYAKCELEDVREMELRLDAMGEECDSRLQSDKLFLYYLQLGKSMYSDTIIEPEHIFDKTYDIDHIYPRSKVKDDSVLNNKVLVLSEENGGKLGKDNEYPIKAEIQRERQHWWKMLLDNKLITEEKYKRLTRNTSFSEEEQWGFINRQLVETRQSTKALATLLKEKYPETEIVYVKAGLVSEFRHQFDMIKSRTVNDLHHAKDAYLNIVVGNVYNGRFTRKWFLENRDTYNLKVETLFKHKVVVDRNTIWTGEEAIGKVKRIVQQKNAMHLTRYAFCRKGKFFNQQPEAAAENLIPRKANLPTEKYGGYSGVTASYVTLVRYHDGKKKQLRFVPIELYRKKEFEKDYESACEYVKSKIGDEIGPFEILFYPRVIKFNSVFQFDGMRAYLTAASLKDGRMNFSMIEPLIIGYPWESYIKKLENFTAKKKENPRMIYSQKFDKISKDENRELYDILTAKLQTAKYIRQLKSCADALTEKRGDFEQMEVEAQAITLLQMVSLFGRVNPSSVTTFNEKINARFRLSLRMENWRKTYKDVRIIDQSASGLFESRSENLFELL